MCGIAGWAHIRPQSLTDQEVLDDMLAAIACRGPDDSGAWFSGHAAIGHVRLAIVDLAGGVQPMTESCDADGAEVVLSFSGEVDNYRTLRRELVSRGHRFRTRSDTEVVLRSYLEWSDGFVERLEGMFALAVWDARKDRLLLTRDRLGIKPLYVTYQSGGVVFGSEIKSVLAHSEVESAVSTEGLADLLGLVGTPGHTPFQGIHEVRPGSLVTVDGDGVRARTYWRLERNPTHESLSESAQTVRQLLADVVTRQTVADVPLCSLLSGGLDSSAIASLAAPVLLQGGRPLRTFAVDFVGADDDFRSDDFRPERDSPYAAEVAAHIGTEHCLIELAANELSAGESRATVLRALDMPITFGDVDASLMLLFRAVRERSTVALSGEGADELFGGYAWFHDETPHTGFPWLSRMELVPSSALTPDFKRATDFDAYRRQRFTDACNEVTHLPNDGPTERRMREVSYLNMTRWLPTLLTRKDRLSMVSGLEVRVPFCDRALVEYVYNTPWKVKAAGGVPKSLLKDAVRDVVPSSVIARQKSPYPTTADIGYETSLRDRASDMVRRDSAALDIVDRNAIRCTLASRTGALDSQLNRNTLETALALDAWFAAYGLSLQ